jgi:anaerobic ribonucleoside-triphosphate reductase activating protein
MKIRLATDTIQRDSIVDGEGIRSVIWTQGCTHHCLGCHNPETHSFEEGYLIDTQDLISKIDSLEGQDGITFSGGDPMSQPEACSLIASHCKEIGLNVWCYTGYTYEQLLEMSKNMPYIMNFLKNIDVLVDGKFILEQKSLNLKFKGSKNQRIIDVPKSLKENKVCLVEKYTTEKSYDKLAHKSHYMYI